MFRNTLFICLGLLIAGTAPCSAQPGIITTIAGGGTLTKSSSNGAIATNAGLNPINGVVTDAVGNCYITQTGAIRMINTLGIINTEAGIDTQGYSGDGLPATNAGLGVCLGVTVDHDGNIYIADRQGVGGFSVVRKVDGGKIITTYAGNGAQGYAGGGGPAISCELGMIGDMAVDQDNNLYMADQLNHAVWKVDKTGIINVVAGNFTMGSSGDNGPATAAQIQSPSGIVVDHMGNLYIADEAGHVVKMVNISGVITTVAGNGSAGYTGDGSAATAAQLNTPRGLGIDGAGNVYIADVTNNVIRKLSRDGVISTVAGNGTAGYSGNGGPAVAATLKNPTDVAIDGAGNMYIADRGNFVIRKVGSVLGVNELRCENTVTIYPNPCRNEINLRLAMDGRFQVVLENIVGQAVYETEVESRGKAACLAIPAYVRNGAYVVRWRSRVEAGTASLNIAR